MCMRTYLRIIKAGSYAAKLFAPTIDTNSFRYRVTYLKSDCLLIDQSLVESYADDSSRLAAIWKGPVYVELLLHSLQVS